MACSGEKEYHYAHPHANPEVAHIALSPHLLCQRVTRRVFWTDDATPVTHAYNLHTYRHIAMTDDNKLLYRRGGILGLASETVKYEVQKRDIESEMRPGVMGIGSEDGMFFLV